MSRRFVSQLAEGENVSEIYLLADKQLRTNRAGNLYIQLRLSDRTGSIVGMVWNANERLYGEIEGGGYVKIEGATQFHNGVLQLIVKRVDRADTSQVNEEDFVTLGPAEVERLTARLAEMVRGVKNYHLRNLGECFLVDEAFMQRFTKAPAGIKNHHAYHGGLLEHVVSLMEVVAVVGPRYDEVNDDLLLMGAFLHDAGKIDELLYEREMAYSDAGQLLGHLVMGVGLVEEKVREAEKLSGEPFPAELAMRLKHMIVSHHGEYEHGSPKLPMTLEAVALHFLDNLDAKIHSLSQLIREDVDAESNWTAYQPSLGRKVFKG